MLDVRKLTLDQYLAMFEQGGSVYPKKKKEKDGTVTETGVETAFYYMKADGTKSRKVLSARNKEHALERKRQFLTGVYKNFSEPVPAVVRSEIPTVVRSEIPVVQPVETCKVTVREATEKYLDYYKGKVAYRTYQGKVIDLKRINKSMGDQLLENLDVDCVQSMINDISIKLDGTLAAPKTVKATITSFKTLMKYCRQKKWIMREDVELLTEDIKIPTAIKDSTHEEEVKAAKFLEYSELGYVLSLLADNPYYFYLIRIASLTGLRPQELLGLKKSDLYPEEHYIEVKTAVKGKERRGENDRGVELGAPKNKYSRRKVPATDEVFVYFKKLEKVIIETGGRKRSVEQGNQDLIVVDRNGNVPDVHALGTNLVRYLERRKAEKKITLGMPRHCYQDYLDGLDARESDVEKAVGHVLLGMGNKAYKNNENYLERLLPLIEKMGKNIESAYQAVLQEQRLKA